MKNRSYAGTTLWNAFVVALGFGAVAHAGLGYLPLVGPPPLRIQVVKAPDITVTPLNLSADTNLASTLAATEAIPMPPNIAGGFSTTNSTDDVQTLSLGADNMNVDPFGTSTYSMASPDLLNITPQMLAAYFHPVAHGTNGVPDVTVPVIFMPPAVRTLQPSSHAEYIVK